MICPNCGKTMIGGKCFYCGSSVSRIENKSRIATKKSEVSSRDGSEYINNFGKQYKASRCNDSESAGFAIGLVCVPMFLYCLLKYIAYKLGGINVGEMFYLIGAIRYYASMIGLTFSVIGLFEALRAKSYIVLAVIGIVINSISILIYLFGL